MTTNTICDIRDSFFQIDKAFDAFARNNLTLDWFAIPHNEDCVYDKSPSCKDDF